MELKKLSPWNWFKKERESQRSNVPVHHRHSDAYLPVHRLHNQIDRLFGDMFVGDSDELLPRLWPAVDLRSMFVPQLDIKESADHYDISIEVPGMERTDIDIQVEADNLIVCGEKKYEKETNDENYHCMERSYGSFRRVLSLPQDADADDIKANYDKGVLSINVKRNPNRSVSGRRITIEG